MSFHNNNKTEFDNLSYFLTLLSQVEAVVTKLVAA